MNTQDTKTPTPEPMFYARNNRTGLYWDGDGFAANLFTQAGQINPKIQAVTGPQLAVIRATYANVQEVEV